MALLREIIQEPKKSYLFSHEWMLYQAITVPLGSTKEQPPKAKWKEKREREMVTLPASLKFPPGKFNIALKNRFDALRQLIDHKIVTVKPLNKHYTTHGSGISEERLYHPGRRQTDPALVMLNAEHEAQIKKAIEE